MDKIYLMRVRVPLNWASKGWGGMEVVGKLWEGDPDKTLVTIRGTRVNINSGGSAFSGGVREKLTPQPPDEAQVKN